MKSLSILAIALLLFRAADGQYMEKVSFDSADSTNGYYLAIRPTSQTIRGVLVFFCTFRSRKAWCRKPGCTISLPPGIC